MSSTRVLVVAALVTAGVAPAGAQVPGMGGSPRPIQVVLSGGLTLPSGDLADLHDSGFHYDVSLLLNLAGFPIALRPELSVSRLALKDQSAAASGGDVTQFFAMLGNIELPLGGGLYVLAGGGILSVSLAEAATVGSGESASKLTFDAGAGFRFRLGGASGFVEARMGTASYEQGKFGFSKAQFIPVTFGLVF